jgi:tetratricopeptide (TPR) repeat protein
MALFFSIFSLLYFFTANSLMAAPLCGNLENAYGPFDYTNPDDFKNRLPIVTGAHFTPEVESLIRGKSGYIWGDLDYTLRAFPNHHRALYAFIRYEMREREKAKAKGGNYQPPSSDGFPKTAECYFDRAIRWRPSDPNVRLIYGIYLQMMGKMNEALEQYKISEKMQPKSADLNYNMGLLYFDLKQYSLSKQYAQKAYQLGYPLPGLRKKLAGVGQWP